MQTAGKIATAIPGTNVPVPAPVPTLQVPTVPAPGKKGPRGVVGRQTYSRVNTGTPPVVDAGAASQKSIPPAGATKTSEVSMTNMAVRPSLQDMLKSAMAGTVSAAGSAVSRIKVAEEAKRQLENLEGEEGEAIYGHDDIAPQEKVSSEYVQKLASAVEYCADLLVKEGADIAEAKAAPGVGPNTLPISETALPPAVNEKDTGQAVSSDQPPVVPPTKKGLPAEHGATLMENDEDSAIPPAKVARVMKIAEDPGIWEELGRRRGEHDARLHPAVRKKLMMGGWGAYGGLTGGLTGAAIGAEVGKSPEAAVVGGLGGAALGAGLGAGLGYAGSESSKGYLQGVANSISRRNAAMGKSAGVAYLRALKKQAEDAINSSNISAGPIPGGVDSPPGVVDVDQAGPPAQDKGKVPAGHDATRAFTRAQAKATPKAEMRAVLDEPMMSPQTDKTLDVILDNEGDNKIGHVRDVAKVAAARALLSKLRQEAGR